MNAAGRMADAGDVIELFLTGDATRARALAEQLNQLNQERQQAEAEMLRSILDQCLATPVTSGDRALVFSGPGWHRGVVGIVASRLVDRFHRPVVVLSVDPETGLAHGLRPQHSRLSSAGGARIHARRFSPGSAGTGRRPG